jgi:catechol 2,3-dioxygenase-like lactoylglutathione lyase family enzyme
MKRFHVHVSVNDIDASVRFYSGLFAAEPVVRESDYAKWMLEDPRLNFAISTRGAPIGIEHLGIQVTDKPELDEVYRRLKTVDGPVLEEGETVCCYAKSEKSWVEDPQGVRWETFLSTGPSTTYGGDSESPSACCTPAHSASARDPGESCCTAEQRDRAVKSKAACCG